MWWRYLILIILQTSTLAAGQAMFKLFLNRVHKIEFSWDYIKEMTVQNGLIILGMVAFFLSSLLLWTYALKKLPFSQAYPLSSLSFIFGMVLAYFMFSESIPFTRWIGVFLIVAGCFLISMK